jgi:DNA-binding GntR family transcriptional regulator
MQTVGALVLERGSLDSGVFESTHFEGGSFGRDREWLPAPTKASTAYRSIRTELWHFRIRNTQDLTGQRLAHRFDVSRNTITRALDRLAGERMLRRISHGRHAPYVPSIEEMTAAYTANLALVETTYRSNPLILRRAYRRDAERAERLALADRIATTRDADLCASELEVLLRKVARHERGPLADSGIEPELALLSRIRRIEHLILPDQFEDVAQLMRYFYAGRYPKLVRALQTYTQQRIERAHMLGIVLRASQEDGL